MKERWLKNLANTIWLFCKRNYVIDMVFGALLVLIVYRYLPSIVFIYKTNITVIWLLVIPLLIIFIWVGFRIKINKGHLLTSASIIFAVSVYLFSFVYSDDVKIKLLSSTHAYNCSVIQEIYALKQKPEVWQGFVLHFFIPQPYFDNASFVLQKLGTTTGTLLLNSVYEAQGANSLISQVQSLNAQGSNLLFGQFVKENIKMYNEDLLRFASSTGDVFCKNLWYLP